MSAGSDLSIYYPDAHQLNDFQMLARLSQQAPCPAQSRMSPSTGRLPSVCFPTPGAMQRAKSYSR